MKQIAKIFSQHPLLLLLTFYFLFTLINLTLLPIFNDESIYIDWGWISLHVPGNSFISLTDAKQPLLLWIFGIFTTIFPDPLFAGRFVSVIIGSLTVIGIYLLAKNLFDRHVAFLAGFLYAITPIFVFYNRQALLEAGIACVGIWAGYALYQLLQNPTIKKGILLGVILGIGFFMKSSALLFVISSAVTILFVFLKTKKGKLLSSYFFALVSIIVVDFFLLSNPLFWQTLPSNSRYAYTIGDLLSFPLFSWLNNLLASLQIGFVFMTPFVFLAGLWGTYLLAKKKNTYAVGTLFYFILALCLEIFTVKGQNQRYLVDFLPFLILPAAYVFNFWWKRKWFAKTAVVIAFCIPLVLSLMILFVPASYILQTAKVSAYSDTEDLYSYTAGYGINETLAYIQAHSLPNSPTMVLSALWTGNPENALDIYSFKSQNLYPIRVDSHLFQNLSTYQCMTSSYPTFFVTRDGNRAGLDNYFSLVKTIPTYDPTYSLKIYTPKKNCKGNTFSLSTTFQPLINQEMEIKLGL